MLFIEFLVEKGRLRERRQKGRGGFKMTKELTRKMSLTALYIYIPRLVVVGILESFTNTFRNDRRCARGNCNESQFWRVDGGIF